MLNAGECLTKIIAKEISKKIDLEFIKFLKNKSVKSVLKEMNKKVY